MGSLKGIQQQMRTRSGLLCMTDSMATEGRRAGRLSDDHPPNADPSTPSEPPASTQRPVARIALRPTPTPIAARRSVLLVDLDRMRRSTLARALVRPAGSSFRDLAAHGNESRGSWIERRWLLVRDLDECASRDPSGRASRRSRGGGMRSTTSWSAHGSSSGFPTELVQRGSPCSQVAATASCVSGEPGGRFVRASSRSWTRRGAAGHLA